MRERQTCGMEKRPLQSLHGADIARHAAMNTSIGRVADDGVAYGAEMDSDLMGATGMNRDLAQRQTRHVMGTGNPGHGMTGTTRARRHLQAIRGIPSDGRFDSPAGLHDAPHKGNVFLLDFVIVELSRKLVMGRVVLGDHHEPGCAAIESMHDARPELAADAAQVVQMMQQRVDDSAGCVAGTWMDHHAGGLVEDGEVGILIQDVER